MKLIWVRTLLLSSIIIISGCQVQNNYLEPRDFVACLNRNGIDVEGVRPLTPEPFYATSAVGIKIAGSEIGVYKYDRMSVFQEKRLASIAKQKKLHIMGVPYPVAVHGSFVIFGLDKNLRKRDILKALKKFK